MYDNREAILEECGDDIAKAQNTLTALRTNGSWFCFLLMVVIGIDLQRFLLIEAQDQQHPDAPNLKGLNCWMYLNSPESSPAAWRVKVRRK